MTISNMIIPEAVEKTIRDNEVRQNNVVLDVKNTQEYKNRLAQEVIHKMEIEDNKLDNTYQSCCLTSDKRALDFFLKSGVIFSVLIFSMIQVMTVTNASERNAFLNVVMLTLGNFLPSPKIKEDRKK